MNNVSDVDRTILKVDEDMAKCCVIVNNMK
jgi:hypothetical protein